MFDAYKGLTIRHCPDGMSHVSNLQGLAILHTTAQVVVSAGCCL